MRQRVSGHQPHYKYYFHFDNNRLFGFTRQTATRCLAWALMTNHFHLLIKTGRVPAKRHNFQKEK